jgi:ribosomal protein L40E
MFIRRTSVKVRITNPCNSCHKQEATHRHDGQKICAKCYGLATGRMFKCRCGVWPLRERTYWWDEIYQEEYEVCRKCATELETAEREDW